MFYPGLPNHPQHELMKSSMNKEFGFGGMLMIDAGDMKAYKLMEAMQNKHWLFSGKLRFLQNII